MAGAHRMDGRGVNVSTCASFRDPNVSRTMEQMRN